MSVELRDLRAFLAVAEERSFARAADRLNVAQPALSRRVARLEAQLGFALLARTTRRVAETAAGAVFAEHARALLAQLDLAVEAAGRAADGRSGEVGIGYNDFAIAGPLPDVIRGFSQGAGGIWVRMHRAGTEEQLALLRQGRLDVAFVIGPVRAEGLNRQTVWRDPFMAVAAEGDPLMAQPSVGLDALARRPHVMGDRRGWQAYRERVRRLYARVETFPEIVAEGPDTSVILGLVASGIAVTVYPACIENAFRRGVAFRPIADTDATLETAMVWDPDSGNPAALRFVEAALRHCARWPGGRHDAHGGSPGGEVASLEARRASA